jgi:hypothetical protein
MTSRAVRAKGAKNANVVVPCSILKLAGEHVPREGRQIHSAGYPRRPCNSSTCAFPRFVIFAVIIVALWQTKPLNKHLRTPCTKRSISVFGASAAIERTDSGKWYARPGRDVRVRCIEVDSRRPNNFSLKESSGFGVLDEMGRLDLSVEALVVKPEWRGLFTLDELKMALLKLEQRKRAARRSN